MTLLKMAPEIIEQILEYVAIQDVVRCALVNMLFFFFSKILLETLLLMGNARQVCRRLKDIIDDSLLLKYHTEMQSCGMTTASEGPSTWSITLQERYTKLLLFDATWRSLAWRKHEILQMQNSTALWDLYGGVLATGTPINGNRDDWRMEFRELDSMGRRGQGLEVSHWGFQVELPLVEIAMDPTQNFLALLSM